jgi:type IV pilus assembly protein PilC
MAKIGEETGSMPEIFRKISVHYSKELTTRVERIIVAFEPIMILCLGIVIGAVVISLFLPLFKIATGGGM